MNTTFSFLFNVKVVFLNLLLPLPDFVAVAREKVLHLVVDSLPRIFPSGVVRWLFCPSTVQRMNPAFGREDSMLPLGQNGLRVRSADNGTHPHSDFASGRTHMSDSTANCRRPAPWQSSRRKLLP